MPSGERAPWSGSSSGGTYEVLGLVVDSCVPLPNATSTSSALPDLRVRVEFAAERPSVSGRVILETGDSTVGGYIATEGPDGFVLTLHGVGSFAFASSLESVICYPDPACDADLILPVLLTGMIPAFLMYLRGEVLLHASAVVFDGLTTAILGLSGMGKSTLAALWCDRGALLVTDDLLRLDLVQDRPHWVGGSKEIRLRRNPFTESPDRFAGFPTRLTGDGRMALAFPSVNRASGPLDAVIVPHLDRGASAVSIERLTGAAVFNALARYPRLPGWRDPSVLRRQFLVLSELSSRIPVFHSVVPWGESYYPEVVDELARSLSDSVLL